MWILRHAFAVAVLPVTVTILVPRWILRRYGITFKLPTDAVAWLSITVGAILLLAGLASSRIAPTVMESHATASVGSLKVMP